MAVEAAQEALDLAVAAGGRLDVHGPAHPLAASEASPSGGSDRTAATLRHCSAVSSSILENQSRNRARSIVPFPMANASRNPVQHMHL